MSKHVRSLLLVAAGDENLDQKLSWDPDAVVLDLTDLIHPSYFDQAKELIPNQISLLGSRGIFSLVRMSMEQFSDDLGAFVDAGVDAGVDLCVDAGVDAGVDVVVDAECS